MSTNMIMVMDMIMVMVMIMDMIIVIVSPTQHTDIPHVLWDFHSEGGYKNIQQLERKVSHATARLGIGMELSLFYRWAIMWRRWNSSTKQEVL